MNFTGLNLVVACQLPEPYGPPEVSSDYLIDTVSVCFACLRTNLNFRLWIIQVPTETTRPRMTARTPEICQAIGGHENVRAQTGFELLLQLADRGKLRSLFAGVLRVKMPRGSQLMNLTTLFRRSLFRCGRRIPRSHN